MSSFIYGSLCLSATTPQKQFPQFKEPKTFYHTPHTFRGRVDIADSVGFNKAEDEIYIPQRNKEFLVITYSTPDWAMKVNEQLQAKLPLMESSFAFARQLYKFNRIQEEIRRNPQSLSFTSLIINNGDHKHLALLSQWEDVYLYGVYDVVNSNTRLVWTTDEWFMHDVKAQDFTRYVFYRFPVLRDRPLFLYSQALCSKWYGWSKQFQGPDGVLKSFNALENYILKEPELSSLSPENKDGGLTG